MQPHTDLDPALARRPAGSSRTRWALIAFLVIAGFFLLTEHRAHAFAILPYLFFLACPLIHLFHHHGHGAAPGDHRGHGDHRTHVDEETRP